MLFKLEDKKELHKEVNSQWSALSGFNWQYSKSYIMPQHADLLCHTIVFVKFNILPSFSPHFLEVLREHILPHDFPLKQGHSVSPHKLSWDLFLKPFYDRLRIKLFGTIPHGQVFWRIVLHGRLIIRSCQGHESFTNAFFSIVIHKGIYTWRKNLDQCTKLSNYLNFKLIVKRFQRLSHVHPDLIICKVNSRSKELY